MNIIPGFIVKRIYRKGSLRETKEGIAFDLKNVLGPGSITGINFIQINEEKYLTPVIKVLTSGMSVLAEHITPDNPVFFKLNQEGTCLLEGARGLKEGINKIIVNLVSRDIGHVQVTLTDVL